MNFDDLHDPDPPRPGSATLAAVAGRARRIRRRRTALVATGAVLAVAAVAVPTALVVTGDGASEHMVPATVPPEVSTTVPATTVVGPETTAGPSTTLPSTVPEQSPPPPPPSTTTSTTSTTVAPAIGPTIVAVRTDGDAVALDADGAVTVLYDEFNLSDGSGEGGYDAIGVDSVAVTGDGRQFVGLCCEPVAGSWFEVGAPDAVRFGHDLDVSPDGTRLAVAGASFAAVYASDGTLLAEADLSASPVYTQLEHAMWLDDDTLALLAFQDGPQFRLLTADATLSDVDPQGGVVIDALPSPEAAWPVLAGVGDDGSILVSQAAGSGLQYTTTTLRAYDPVTLERRPGSDVTVPAPAVFAWYDDGVLTWIGEDNALHVGDTVVPGEYFWARPVS